MIDRLSSHFFLGIALVTMGIALFPLARYFFGIDETIKIQFLTVVYLVISGLMCGLTAMLLMVKRVPESSRYIDDNEFKPSKALLHASGLLLFSGIPLANFLAAYFLWVRGRHTSKEYDLHGREVVCFQIASYLYLLLALFLVLALIGVFAIPLILIYHLIVTLIGIAHAARGSLFRYPANISIIDRGIEIKELP